MEASAEALADALVVQLARGDTDPDGEPLQSSRRPYSTWALAWAQWSGVLDRQPDHPTARQAVAALHSLEPEANRLDRLAAGFSGSRGSG